MEIEVAAASPEDVDIPWPRGPAAAPPNPTSSAGTCHVLDVPPSDQTVVDGNGPANASACGKPGAAFCSGVKNEKSSRLSTPSVASGPAGSERSAAAAA